MLLTNFEQLSQAVNRLRNMSAGVFDKLKTEDKINLTVAELSIQEVFEQQIEDDTEKMLGWEPDFWDTW